MEITEIRIKLMEDPGERLQAFCSITFDHAFVVRDLKIIEGAHGPFVAMPSRKLTAHCPQCGCKNHLRAGFCNQCGQRLSADRCLKDEEGRTKLYADIAHPINCACREQIQQHVIAAFHAEIEQAKLPGYVSRYDDLDHDTACLGNGSADRAAATGQESTHIQPAERPHGPHRTAARVPAGNHAPPLNHTTCQPLEAHQPPAARREGFGAGIF